MGVELREFEQLTQQLSTVAEECRTIPSQQAGYDVGFGRDPMRPLGVGQGQPADLFKMPGGFSLEGIIWSPKAPVAMIDGEFYRRGEGVGPYTLDEIRQNGIFIVRGKDRQWIPLSH